MATSTTSKKTLAVFPVGEGSNFFYIGFKEGGSIPWELTGQFTSKLFAEQAIERYLRGKNAGQSNSK